MRVLLKSPLKKAANNISRIGFSPKARRVRAFDFDRREEYKKFADFIKNSSEELANAPLPSKRELKKITNFDVVGGGGGGLGFLERRWLLTAGGDPPVAVTSSGGSRMVQLSGRSRLGASRMSTSCLACWRLSTSPLRLKARAMVKACSSWP